MASTKKDAQKRLLAAKIDKANLQLENMIAIVRNIDSERKKLPKTQENAEDRRKYAVNILNLLAAIQYRTTRLEALQYENTIMGKDKNVVWDELISDDPTSIRAKIENLEAIIKNLNVDIENLITQSPANVERSIINKQIELYQNKSLYHTAKYQERIMMKKSAENDGTRNKHDKSIQDHVQKADSFLGMRKILERIRDVRIPKDPTKAYEDQYKVGNALYKMYMDKSRHKARQARTRNVNPATTRALSSAAATARALKKAPTSTATSSSSSTSPQPSHTATDNMPHRPAPVLSEEAKARALETLQASTTPGSSSSTSQHTSHTSHSEPSAEYDVSEVGPEIISILQSIQTDPNIDSEALKNQLRLLISDSKVTLDIKTTIDAETQFSTMLESVTLPLDSLTKDESNVTFFNNTIKNTWLQSRCLENVLEDMTSDEYSDEQIHVVESLNSFLKNKLIEHVQTFIIKNRDNVDWMNHYFRAMYDGTPKTLSKDERNKYYEETFANILTGMDKTNFKEISETIKGNEDFAYHDLNTNAINQVEDDALFDEYDNDPSKFLGSGGGGE